MRGFVAVLAVLIGVVAAAGEAAAYQALPDETVSLIEQCGARVTQRGQPTATGEFYGALFSPSVNEDSRYSRGIGVLVGASVFTDSARFPRLPGVGKDIESMAGLLMNASGPDLGYDVLIELKDEAVTGRNVACLVQNAIPSFIDREMDRLFFYWAGHGLDNGQGRGYLPFYDTPQGPLNDFSALPMLALQEWSRRADVFGGVRQAIFVIDACASGLATDASRSAERLKPLPNGNLVKDYTAFLADYAEIGGRVHVVFTAADKRGPTRETPNGGYFTQEFIRSFDAGATIADDNGVVGHHALAQHLMDRMHDLGNPPRPQVKILSGTSEHAFLLRPESPLLARFAELRAEHLQALRQKQEGGGASGSSEAGGAGARQSAPSIGPALKGAEALVDNCTGGDDALALDGMEYGDLRETRGMCRAVIKLNEINGTPAASPYLSDGALLAQLGRIKSGEQDAAKAGYYFAEAEKEFLEAGRLNGGASGASAGLLDLADLVYAGTWAPEAGGGDEKMLSLARRSYELGDKFGGAHFYAWLKRFGRGTPVDAQAAARLFEESYAAGSASAADNLGKMYGSDELGAPDYEKAKRYYVGAGELGSADGYLNAAALHTDGFISEEGGDAEAMRLIDQTLALDPDHGWALNFKGWMHEQGRSVPADVALAAEFYQRSLDSGFDYAGVNLGYLKRIGIDGVKDTEAAKRLFTQGCNAGQARGCANLADMMIFGEGYQPSAELDAEAARFIDAALAIEPANGFALSLKGYILENGRGVEQDFPAAAEAYRQSGESGNTWAWRNLGHMLLSGRYAEDGTELWAPDPQAAVAAFAQAEARNDPDAMVTLADLAFSGKLGERDAAATAEAVARLERAEKLGSLWAVETLGRFFAGEYGDTADIVAAIRAYRRAAGRGSRVAAEKLAELIETGRVSHATAAAEQLAQAWDYYIQCGDIGESHCYYRAAYALFRRAEGQDPQSAFMVGAAQRPAGQEAVDRLSFLLTQAGGGNSDADILLAALNMAGEGGFLLPTGFEPSTEVADSTLRAAHQAGLAGPALSGLAVSGILDGSPKVAFDDLLAVYAPDMSRCTYNGRLFEDAQTPMFPHVDCGWFDLGLPMWTFGLAETTASVKLRAEPGTGTVLDTLARGERVIYLPLENAAGERWVKVQDDQNRIGWLHADYLRPWTQDTAAATDAAAAQ